MHERVSNLFHLPRAIFLHKDVCKVAEGLWKENFAELKTFFENDKPFVLTVAFGGKWLSNDGDLRLIRWTNDHRSIRLNTYGVAA